MTLKQKKLDDFLSRKVGLKTGDPVIVITGGNKSKRPLKGQTGNIKSFAGKKQDRVIIENVNMITKHQRQTAPGKPSGRVQKEGSIHISNVMYYVEKIKKPVRICHRFLDDGRKVRGYIDSSSKEFVQIDA